MNNTFKRAAIYIRVSTLDQAREGYSLEAQETALRKWCADHRYQVYDLYADKGISAKNIDHRPDMMRLLHDAEQGHFDTVIFWALSRFTRSVQDLYSAMENFARWGIDMVSYTEAFDTSTSMGRAMIGIVGVFAQLERELTGERVKAAMETRAASGKRTCGEVLGYDKYGKDTFIINEREAEYVRYAIQLYLERKNLSEVAKLCKERGYRGKRGRIPCAYSIMVIISNPIYCGYNRFRGQLYRGFYPPLIDVSTYNRVIRLLKHQGKKYGRDRLHPLVYIKE